MAHGASLCKVFFEVPCDCPLSLATGTHAEMHCHPPGYAMPLVHLHSFRQSIEFRHILLLFLFLLFAQFLSPDATLLSRVILEGVCGSPDGFAIVNSGNVTLHSALTLAPFSLLLRL